MKYIPPKPSMVNMVRKRTGITIKESAEMVGMSVSGFEKLVGTNQPSTMTYSRLFTYSSKLVLSEEELLKVHNFMKDFYE